MKDPKNKINFEVWYIATNSPTDSRRLAAFHFRFHADMFLQELLQSGGKHPGNYKVIGVVTCGATGQRCPYERDENGEAPCSECETGKEFRKKWAGQPTLHDED